MAHRFANRPLWLPDGLHWNVRALFAETLQGLATAAADGPLDGIGVDAWGCNYALLDGDCRMLGLPFHYRDERTGAVVVSRAHARVGRAELYSRTGIQTMPINTLFQLLAEAGGAAASAAERIALIPDLLGLWMTGTLVNEATIASTTGLLEAGGRRWAMDLVERLGVSPRPFAGEVVAPGFGLGPLLAGHAGAAGAAVGAPVRAVAGHDTASAFAAAPLDGPHSAVLSSGTWSLLGLELDEPQLGADAAGFNLTNERFSAPVCELVDSCHGAEAATVGAACPDHLVHTKRVPMWVAYDPARDGLDELRARLAPAAGEYRKQYEAYFERHAADGDVMPDPDPRVVLIENLGMVAVGQTPKAARISRDLYHRAIKVMAGAGAISEFVSLTESESFAVEYWPLELYKLSLAPPPGELQGRVALVTGAAGGIGRAVLQALVEAGTCVVAFDIDGDGAADAVADMGDAGISVSGDVTSEAAVADAFAAAVSAFGGVDIVISNAGIASSAPITETTLAEWERNQSVLGTGYFLVAREAFKVLEAQRRGGSIVFVASKNSLVAGRNASAYSAAKAAELHLARCLAEEGGPAGIRVNTVNPDAVLQGSRIWDSSWRTERADAYGIDPRRARGALPATHHAGRQRRARRHRSSGAALRFFGAFGQDHREPAQRLRRRRRRLPR